MAAVVSSSVVWSVMAGARHAILITDTACKLIVAPDVTEAGRILCGQPQLRDMTMTAAEPVFDQTLFRCAPAGAKLYVDRSRVLLPENGTLWRYWRIRYRGPVIMVWDYAETARPTRHCGFLGLLVLNDLLNEEMYGTCSTILLDCPPGFRLKTSRESGSLQTLQRLVQHYLLWAAWSTWCDLVG